MAVMVTVVRCTTMTDPWDTLKDQAQTFRKIDNDLDEMDKALFETCRRLGAFENKDVLKRCITLLPKCDARFRLFEFLHDKEQKGEWH